MLPKEHRLQLRNEAGLFANSQKIRSEHLLVYVGKEPTEIPLFGIIVKKNLCVRASERNKFKRWLRESIRHTLVLSQQESPVKPRKYVVLLLKKVASLDTLKSELKKLISP